MKLAKACRKIGCSGKSTERHGYCPEHAKLASWGKHQEERGKNPYNCARWRNTRAAVMKRDKGLCQECLRNGRFREGNHCDHIKPISQGGAMYKLTNLQILCSKCHDHKTATERR